jgi:hypothetical protein
MPGRHQALIRDKRLETLWLLTPVKTTISINFGRYLRGGTDSNDLRSVSRADSANVCYHLIRSPKSVPDTVFPSRRAECHDTYPTLVYLTDKLQR